MTLQSRREGVCAVSLHLCFRYITLPSRYSMGYIYKPKNQAWVTAGWWLNLAQNSLYHPNLRDSKREEVLLQPMQTVAIDQDTYKSLTVPISSWADRDASGEKMRPSLWFCHVLQNFHIWRPLLRSVLNNRKPETIYLRGVNCLSEVVRH